MTRQVTQGPITRKVTTEFQFSIHWRCGPTETTAAPCSFFTQDFLSALQSNQVFESLMPACVASPPWVASQNVQAECIIYQQLQ